MDLLFVRMCVQSVAAGGSSDLFLASDIKRSTSAMAAATAAVKPDLSVRPLLTK